MQYQNWGATWIAERQVTDTQSVKAFARVKNEIRGCPELFLDFTGSRGHELDLIGLVVFGYGNRSV